MDADVKIIFLGTGGGRDQLVNQDRGSGGFRIIGSKALHVDPGPGALLRCIEFGVVPGDVDILVVTHNHLDHVNDANVMIEAMRNEGKEGKSGLVVGKSVLGNENFDRAITRYHQGMLKETHMVSANDIIRSDGVTIAATKTKHGDPDAVGFVCEMDGKRIGCTGDGQYFPEMEKPFEGCDMLVMNVLLWEDGIPDHLSTNGAIEFLNKLKEKPKQVIIQHFCGRMIQDGPEREARKIEQATGTPTVAATDGMVVNTNKIMHSEPIRAETPAQKVR